MNELTFEQKLDILLDVEAVKKLQGSYFNEVDKGLSGRYHYWESGEGRAP